MAKWLSRLRGKPQPEKWWSFGGGDGWFSTTGIVPPYPGRMFNIAGTLVTMESAMGLPAVAAAIRLLGETTGMVPLLIYRGDPPDREKARETWQWYRLHERPNDEQSAFDFFEDIETSIESWGDGFVWKAKARPVIRDEQDIQLFVMDAATVRIAREEGKKVFKVREGSVEKTYDFTNILHVRGWSARPGKDGGTSPISLHRETLGAALARQQYEGKFFTNNAQTSLALVVPDPVPDDQAQEIVDRFVEQHTGRNAYRPAFLSGGGDIKTLSISQHDAQYIEQQQFGIEDTARMFHITAVGMLRQAMQGAQPAKDDFERFLKVDLAPRLRRIEMAFKIDEDLFPRGDELFPEFLTDAILKPDIQARFAAYKDAVQGGWMEGNEIRERENLPQHPDGSGLQKTPVGGAPNPAEPPATNGGQRG